MANKCCSAFSPFCLFTTAELCYSSEGFTCLHIHTLSACAQGKNSGERDSGAVGYKSCKCIIAGHILEIKSLPQAENPLNQASKLTVLWAWSYFDSWVITERRNRLQTALLCLCDTDWGTRWATQYAVWGTIMASSLSHYESVCTCDIIKKREKPPKNQIGLVYHNTQT